MVFKVVEKGDTMLKETAVAFFCLFLSSALFCEEKGGKEEVPDVKVLAEKISVFQEKMSKTEEEFNKQQEKVEELTEQVEKLKELTERLTRVLRDLEIYVKRASVLRPDEQTWESVERGMSDQDIDRILGTPEEVTVLRRGGERWYYYGLGSVTFDERGFVTGRSDFKEFPQRR